MLRLSFQHERGGRPRCSAPALCSARGWHAPRDAARGPVLSVAPAVVQAAIRPRADRGRRSGEELADAVAPKDAHGPIGSDAADHGARGGIALRGSRKPSPKPTSQRDGLLIRGMVATRSRSKSGCFEPRAGRPQQRKPSGDLLRAVPIFQGDPFSPEFLQSVLPREGKRGANFGMRPLRTELH
jgi:hypothetical protein